MANQDRKSPRGIRCPSCSAPVAESDARYNRPDGSYHPACYDGLRPGLDATIWRDLEETARRIEMAVAGLTAILRPEHGSASGRRDTPIERERPTEDRARGHGVAPAPTLSAAPPSAPLAQRLIALPGEPWAESLRLSAS